MNVAADQTMKWIVRPVTTMMGPRFAGEAGVQLVGMTIATESGFTMLRQVAGYRDGQPLNGPARGLPMIERPTYHWMVEEIDSRPVLRDAVRPFRPADTEDPYSVVWSAGWAVAVCRARYWLDPQPLPDPADFQGLYGYYKRLWNTELGAATPLHVWDMCWACFGPSAPYLREGTRP